MLNDLQAFELAWRVRAHKGERYRINRSDVCISLLDQAYARAMGA